MKRLFLASLAILLSFLMAPMSAAAQESGIQPVLQLHQAVIANSSRKTIGPAIDAIAASGLPQGQTVLETWAAKSMWMRKADGVFFKAEETADKSYRLTDFDTGEMVGTYSKKELKQLKPNSGIRAMIGTALVKFQLTDADAAKRWDALTSIQRDPEAALLAPLRASIDAETDGDLKAQKLRLERLLTIGYDDSVSARVAAIKDMSGDIGVDVRATLNPLVATTLEAGKAIPSGANVARTLIPGNPDFSEDKAYDLLV